MISGRIKISLNESSSLELARLLVIFLIGFATSIVIATPKIFVPFFPFLETINSIPNYQTVISFLIIVSCASILLGWKYRVFSLILGILLLTVISYNRVQFGNNRMLLASGLILIGLTDQKYFLNVQMGIMYFGAALNKILDVHWINGVFMSNFVTLYKGSLLEMLFNEAPNEVYVLLGWSTIIIEFILAIGFICNRRLSLFVFIGLFFHGGMLLLTGGKLSVLFLYLILSLYLFLIRENDFEVTLPYSKVKQRIFRWIIDDKHISKSAQPAERIDAIVVLKAVTLYSQKLHLLVALLYVSYFGNFANNILDKIITWLS
ncbi:MAG: hypothetical protein RIF33_04585 [Cyclobacteriaceae bacterium]